jgi:hypothetical protein
MGAEFISAPIAERPDYPGGCATVPISVIIVKGILKE